MNDNLIYLDVSQLNKTIIIIIIKYAKISCNFLKMSGFSSKNVRYPRYQDTGFLQLGGLGSVCAVLNFSFIAGLEVYRLIKSG